MLNKAKCRFLSGKKQITLLMFGSAVLLIFFNGIAETQSPCDSPVVGDHSGAPGETTCSGCHSAPVNPDVPDLHFEVGNNETIYIPGKTYLVHLSIARNGHDKFGFVCSSLDTLNTSKGTFGLINTTATRKYTLGGRNYISHTPCGADSLNKISWTYNWTAPATNKGKIQIYMSMLVANHDHALTGDTTYTKVLTLIPSSVSGINEVSTNAISKVFPTLFDNEINIEFDSSFGNDKKIISIISMEGKIIEIFSTHEKKIGYTPKNNLNQGLYSLQITCNDIVQTKKIIKQ